MTDYLRPASQWADDANNAYPSDLVPWSFNYDPEERLVTLYEFRRRIRAGLVYTGSSTDGEDTVRTWTLTNDVNGQAELQVALSGDRVVIYAPAELPDLSGPAGTGDDFILYGSTSGDDFVLS